MNRRDALASLSAALAPTVVPGRVRADGRESKTSASPPAGESGDDAVFTMRPIGRIENKSGTGSPAIRVFDAYADGLLGLDQWSHLLVLYWFDRNDTPEGRKVLRVHPRGEQGNPMTGVFACRSPHRPNLIAVTVCRIAAVEGTRVWVDAIDAFDGTPVLDLKPYTPADQPAGEIRVPAWARKGPAGPGRR